MNVYIYNSRLPSAYQEVEYIQSSGTQYIDTGISANQYLSFEVDFQSMGTTNKTTFFGARTGGGTDRFGLMIYEGKFHMMIGNTSATSWDKSIDNNRHKGSVFLNNGAFTGTFDGNSDTGSAGTTVYVNKNFLLFKYDYSDSSGTYTACPMKLYSFKLYTGSSNLVRNFVPCYRKSDNVIGMYDLVNNQFYTNAGTGTFSKGNDIAMSELKQAYIGDCTGWEPGVNTVMYYPFKNDQLDKIGNSSIPITGTKQTIGYKFTSSAAVNLSNPPTACRFVSVWMKYISAQGDYSQTASTYIGGVLYNFAHINSSYLKRFQYHSNSSSSETLAKYPVSNQANTSANQWYHLAYGTDGTKVYAYLNGDKIWEANITPGLYTNTAMTLMQMMECEMSEFIGEKVCWTAQEVQDYYNKTKDEYLSKTMSYSYDFRSKSLSQVKSDGWTFTNGESYVTLDSNGIMSHSGTSTGVNNPHFYVPVTGLQEALNGGSILTMEVQFYGSTSAWGPTNLGGICSALSGRDFTDLQSIHFSLMTSSGYTNWGELVARDGTTGTSVCKYTSSVSSGTYKFKATINLSTGAATLQRNSETALTGTISAANLAAIKRCNKVAGRVGHDVGDLYIQTININVE